MDKKYYSPVELVKIATQHAYSADHLLDDNARVIEHLQNYITS